MAWHGIVFCFLFFPTQLGSERRPLLHERRELNSKIPTEGQYFANARLPGSSLPPPPPSASFAPSLQDPLAQRDTARQPEHRSSSPRMYGGKCMSWRIPCLDISAHGASLVILYLLSQRCSSDFYLAPLLIHHDVLSSTRQPSSSPSPSFQWTSHAPTFTTVQCAGFHVASPPSASSFLRRERTPGLIQYKSPRKQHVNFIYARYRSWTIK